MDGSNVFKWIENWPHVRFTPVLWLTINKAFLNCFHKMNPLSHVTRGLKWMRYCHWLFPEWTLNRREIDILEMFKHFNICDWWRYFDCSYHPPLCKCHLVAELVIMTHRFVGTKRLLYSRNVLVSQPIISQNMIMWPALSQLQDYVIVHVDWDCSHFHHSFQSNGTTTTLKVISEFKFRFLGLNLVRLGLDKNVRFNSTFYFRG